MIGQIKGEIDRLEKAVQETKDLEAKCREESGKLAPRAERVKKDGKVVSENDACKKICELNDARRAATNQRRVLMKRLAKHRTLLRKAETIFEEVKDEAKAD